MTSEIPEIVEK